MGDPCKSKRNHHNSARQGVTRRAWGIYMCQDVMFATHATLGDKHLVCLYAEGTYLGNVVHIHG